MKKTLLKYELEMLERGAQEERAKDIQLHSHPKYETNTLLQDYYYWVISGTHYDVCVVEALRDIYGFWNTYFNESPEKAWEIKRAKESAELERLTAETLAAHERQVKELEALIAEREAEKAAK